MRLYGWFGLALLAISGFCLFQRIEPFTTLFYCFAWWAYILIADALLLKFRGKSLLSGSLDKFWPMLPISVFVWLLFESYNFVIRNWSYNIAPPQIWLRWPGYAVAFSTVLPGIFITSGLADLLLGRSRGPAAWEHEALTEQPRTKPSPVFISLGLILTAAPLVWPRYFFPAVWIGPIFLLDPMLEKAGIKSLSISIASGNRRRVWSIVVGGMACGLIWEFWNYWAGSKWTYSIPYLGQWKVFEMPLLGFLGFPPFALECWILYHLIRAIPRHMDSNTARIAWWIGLGIVSIIIFRGIDTRTVNGFVDLFR